jgi:hypothetical protein
MDMTREQVIAWCRGCRISFNARDSRPSAPDGWSFAYTGGAGDEVLLTAVFTNTEDADITEADVWRANDETPN